MKKLKYYKIILFRMFICSAAILLIVNVKMNGQQNNFIADFIITTYGYIDLWNKSNQLMSVISWLLPQLLLIILLGNYIEKEVIVNADMIFTRTNRRLRILSKYLSILFFMVSLYFIMQLIMEVILGIIKGCFIFPDIDSLIKLMIVILYNYLMIIIVNAISIYLRSEQSVLIVFLIQFGMFSIIFKSVEYSNLNVKYVPLANVIFVLKNANINISGVFSVYYLLLCIIIVILITEIFFKRKEIL